MSPGERCLESTRARVELFHGAEVKRELITNIQFTSASRDCEAGVTKVLIARELGFPLSDFSTAVRRHPELFFKEILKSAVIKPLKRKPKVKSNVHASMHALSYIDS
jgi:hypothetical protein